MHAYGMSRHMYQDPKEAENAFFGGAYQPIGYQ